MEEPALSVRDLRVEDDRGRRILDGLHFEMGAHEAVGLIGRSGAGKSTLVSLLSGWLPRGLRCPTGEIRAFGHRVFVAPGTFTPSAAVPLGVLWQDAASTFDPLRSITEHIEELRSVALEFGRTPAPAAALLEQVGLEAAVGRAHPHQLSGGMLQRAQLAVVLATAPALIVADEPTTALDPPSELEVLSALRSASADGRRGMLFISHDRALVERMTGRLLVLEAGQCVEQGVSARA